MLDAFQTLGVITGAASFLYLCRMIVELERRTNAAFWRTTELFELHQNEIRTIRRMVIELEKRKDAEVWQ